MKSAFDAIFGLLFRFGVLVKNREVGVEEARLVLAHLKKIDGVLRVILPE